MDFTDEEKEILTMLFKMMHTILESCDGYFEMYDGQTFGRGDLMKLAKKLDIEY